MRRGSKNGVLLESTVARNFALRLSPKATTQTHGTVPQNRGTAARNPPCPNSAEQKTVRRRRSDVRVVIFGDYSSCEDAGILFPRASPNPNPASVPHRPLAKMKHHALKIPTSVFPHRCRLGVC